MADLTIERYHNDPPGQFAISRSSASSEPPIDSVEHLALKAIPRTDSGAAATRAARHSSDESVVALLSGVSELQIALAEPGDRLFRYRRFFIDSSGCCATCHDLAANCASAAPLDIAMDGEPLPLNTPILLNAALSFRFKWEGEFRRLEQRAAAPCAVRRP
jgi:cytochrome c peroxidase